MIFRNKDIEIEKSVCLVCDELFGADTGAIAKEFLEKYANSTKRKCNQQNIWNIQHKEI